MDRDSWYLAAADSSVLLRELLRQGTELPPPSAGVAAAGDGLATWEGLMRAIGELYGRFKSREQGLGVWTCVHTHHLSAEVEV